MAFSQEERTQDSDSKERAREGGSTVPPTSSSPRAAADSSEEKEGRSEQRKLSFKSKKNIKQPRDAAETSFFHLVLSLHPNWTPGCLPSLSRLFLALHNFS